MAKRFTDTEKWKDEWFLELEPLMKLLWIYILDTCDYAGVWKVNFRLASYSIGTALDRQSALNALGERVHVISIDKWHIPKFITYQQKGLLNPGNKAHKGIINLLEYHNIQSSPFIAPSKPLGSKADLIEGVQVKEQVKVSVKDSSFLSSFLKKEELVNTNPTEKSVTADYLINKWNSDVNGINKLSHCHGLSGSDSRELITTLSYPDFKKLETWELIFNKIKSSEFLNGAEGSFVATLNWTVKHDNALKVLNGQYSGASNAQKPSSKSKTPVTLSNPTGNPYRAQRIANGDIA